MEKTNLFKHKNYNFEIFDKPKIDTLNYDAKFGDLENETEEYSAKFVVQISDNCGSFSNYLLIGSGQFSRFQSEMILFDGDDVLICCGGTIFCFQISEFKIKWLFELDEGIGFAVYKYLQKYFIKGEQSVTALDLSGNFKWEFSGADIFGTPEGDDKLEIDEKGVLVVDWNYTRHKIDFEGNLLWDTHNK